MKNAAQRRFPRSARETGRFAKRSGMTFVELIIAMTIMAMVVGTMEMLAEAVHSSYGFNEAHGTATQHARVTFDRIRQIASEAKANARFPGYIVWSDRVGTTTFPDTLVVWHPKGPPVSPTGLPRFNELIVYCPSPTAPNQLLEITVVGDSRRVPSLTNTSAWATEIAAIRQNPLNARVALTDLLQTFSTPHATTRGALRFAARLKPSDASYAQYKAGTITFQSVDWAQGICGGQEGLRQSQLRIEAQLTPASDEMGANAAQLEAVPYFGSVALYYMLGR